MDGSGNDKWLELMDNFTAGIEPQLLGFKLHRTGIIYNSLDIECVPFPSLVPPRHIHRRCRSLPVQTFASEAPQTCTKYFTPSISAYYQ
jgi:hypothetical protein